MGTRDDKGRFVPGHPGGPGRPRKTVEDEVLTKLSDKITSDVVVDTIISLINHATSWRAQQAGIELYMHYMLGKPTQRVLTGSMASPDDWVQSLKEDESDDVR